MSTRPKIIASTHGEQRQNALNMRQWDEDQHNNQLCKDLITGPQNPNILANNLVEKAVTASRDILS